MKKQEIESFVEQAEREKKTLHVTSINPLTHKKDFPVTVESPFDMFEFGFRGRDSDNPEFYPAFTYESVTDIKLGEPALYQ